MLYNKGRVATPKGGNIFKLFYLIFLINRSLPENFINIHYQWPEISCILKCGICPGIERELYSLADFVKFTGQLVKVKVKTEIDGQKTFVGEITSVDGEKITIDDRTKGAVSFEYPEVTKGKLKVDLSKEFGHR